MSITITAPPCRLAIFDLDGVIVDSEPIHESVRGELLYALSGGKTRALDADPTGTGTAAYYARFIRAHGASGTGEKTAHRHYALVLDGIRAALAAPIPGVIETLERLDSAGVLLAVASSSPKFYVNGVLAHFDLTKYFCAVACGDEVEHLKPAPDVYELALARAGVAAGSAIAIEDSASGLQAALHAGLACVGFAAPALRPQNLDGAACRIGRMEDFAPIVLGETENAPGALTSAHVR